MIVCALVERCKCNKQNRCIALFGWWWNVLFFGCMIYMEQTHSQNKSDWMNANFVCVNYDDRSLYDSDKKTIIICVCMYSLTGSYRNSIIRISTSVCKGMWQWVSKECVLLLTNRCIPIRMPVTLCVPIGKNFFCAKSKFIRIRISNSNRKL